MARKTRREPAEDAEAFVEILDAACRELERYGFRPDDYGGTDDIVSCIRKLGDQRNCFREEVGKEEVHNARCAWRKMTREERAAFLIWTRDEDRREKKTNQKARDIIRPMGVDRGQPGRQVGNYSPTGSDGVGSWRA